MHLVGGVPRYDLTIMDFERWGMSGAIMRLRDTSADGMNLMDKCLRWTVPVTGREHHASWFKDIDHPDARLIAAAPDLLAALERARPWMVYRANSEDLAIVDEAIAKATSSPCISACAIAKGEGNGKD